MRKTALQRRHRQRERRIQFERLEARRLLVYAPGTPTDYIDLFPDDPGAPLGGGGDRFQVTTRWMETATNGAGLGQGDPTTLTWGIVPDGTQVPATGGGASAASNLIARLDQIYGGANLPITQKPWFDLFQRVFDSWENLSGIDYEYESADDGVLMANANPGILGTRPDVRIGGRNIDGNSGILGFNFFPDFGDMVLDTNDNFFSNNAGNNDDIALRNVVGHEAGHGLGFLHSCPIDNTKLMEPFINLGFDGPQHDDILSAHRHYGDNREPNDDTNSAFDLGTLSDGVTTLGDPAMDDYLSIDDAADTDVFQFIVNGGTAGIRLSPFGLQYMEGPQSQNPCSAGTPFDSKLLSNLDVQLLDSAGNVLATANVGAVGQDEIIPPTPLPDAGTYFIRVNGDTANIQLYTLELTLTDVPTEPPPPPGGPGISGIKYSDLNANGVQDPGEPGLPGFFIYVDQDLDGQIDLGEPAAISGRDGRYTINFNDPGMWEVREVNQPGWQQTFPAGGFHLVELGTGMDNSMVDFGNTAFRDFGDLEESYGTLDADGGASHGIMPAIHLGSLIDGEGDGLPSEDGDGDDVFGLDDEDGVRFTSPAFAGLPATIEVDVELGGFSPAALQGFIDFNGDGVFGPGEQIIKDMVLPEGTHEITYTVPAGAAVGMTGARFRYGYERGLGPTGPSRVGEVEDYDVLVLADIPVANDDRFIVEQDSINNQFDVLNNDFPSSAGPLTIVATSLPNQGGGVRIAPDGRSLFYTPARNFFSPPNETFTYTVDDGTGTQDTATVTVTVNPAFTDPIVVDDTFFVSAGSQRVPMDVLANDLPGTNGPLTIISAGGASSGVVEIDNRGTPNPSDDIILFTPGPIFSDFDQFTYTVSNALGVLVDGTVTVQEVPDPLNDDVVFGFRVLNQQGEEVQQATVGDRLTLQTTVDDNRFFPPNPQGVAAAYLDVLYDRNLASVVIDAQNPLGMDIDFSSDYSEVISGNGRVPGVIDEVGAFQSGLDPKGADPLVVFEVDFTANAAGTLTFVGDPADISPDHDVLLFDPPAPVALADIFYPTATVEILANQNFAAFRFDQLDVNGDGYLSPVDALAIINDLNVYGAHPTNPGEGEGEAANGGHPLDVNEDQLVSALDAMIVINALNGTAAEGEGEALVAPVAAADDTAPANLLVATSPDVTLTNTETVRRSPVTEDPVAAPSPVVAAVDVPVGHEGDTDGTQRGEDDESADDWEDLLDILAEDVTPNWTK